MLLSSLQIVFNAFMIVTGTTGLNSQTYTAYIEVCSGTACTAYVSIHYQKNKRSTSVTKSVYGVSDQVRLLNEPVHIISNNVSFLYV